MSQPDDLEAAAGPQDEAAITERLRQWCLVEAAKYHDPPNPEMAARWYSLAIIVAKFAERGRLLREAAELADRATDWNLTEVEIGGKMVSVYDLAARLREAARQD